MKKIQGFAMLLLLAALSAAVMACSGCEEQPQTPAAYEVAFESNGGSAVAKLTGIGSGAKIAKPADPTKDGYTFDGWYKEADLGNAWNFDADTVAANITLYAKWSPDSGIPAAKYEVAFESNGGSAVAKLTGIESGAKIAKPAGPTKDGYDFDGWYKSNADFSPADKWNFDADTVTKNMTLYACWLEKEADAIWGGSVAASFAGGTGTESNPYKISNGAQLARLADLVNNGTTDAVNGGNFNGNTKHYALTNDIYLNDTSNWRDWGEYANADAALAAGIRPWTAIGKVDTGREFCANFDGGGFAIRGIYINTSSNTQGVFGYVSGGKIQNVGTEQSRIRGGAFVGGVAGNVQDGGSLTHCYNTGDVFGYRSVGGVAGGDCFIVVADKLL